MMRRLLMIMATLGITVASSGCWGGTSGGGGGEGEGCRNSVFGANPCDPGLVCIDTICESCGDPGEPCCSLNTCNGAFECRSIGGERVCEDCGEPGEMCCPSDLGPSCADGVYCDVESNVCETPATDPCAGSTPREFWGRDSGSGCATGSVIVSADDLGMAEACAQSMLSVSEVRTTPPTPYEMCEESPFYVCEDQTRYAWSADDAESCAQALCGASCEVQAGMCPGEGRCLSMP